MLDRYFTLEDPSRLEPAHRELKVQAVLSSGLRLRGYIDRLDISAAGDVRIVDYKTGTAPREEFEARALFQMRFYALVLWRTTGTVPKLLQLIYLGNGEIVRYAPDEADLLATERKVEALWQAIERAIRAQDWRPRRSRLCDWCAHQQLCPEFGGTPPPLPTADPAVRRVSETPPAPLAPPDPLIPSAPLVPPDALAPADALVPADTLAPADSVVPAVLTVPAQLVDPAAGADLADPARHAG